MEKDIKKVVMTARAKVDERKEKNKTMRQKKKS